MEFIIAGAIAGVLLAIALAKVIWVVISGAVDNLYRWLIYSFGNENAVRALKDSDDE